MTHRRRETASGRAQIAFLLYAQLGTKRSLRHLHGQLEALGVHLSLATLKRYSTRYGWQDEAARFDTEALSRRRDTALEHVLAMQDRHAQIARAVQGAGGSALQRLMASDRRLGELRAAEIARLLDLGLRAERQATVETTNRKEIAVLIWNVVTAEVVSLFRQVNGEDDEHARAAAFARGLDRSIEHHLATLAREES